ncbi:MAG TPA: hypothetical protein VHB21_28140, partial [Minicystis sp.]|nr:hypothetical protein [Minicystis sp.]
VAWIATVGADASSGKLVRLARLRGDLPPPVVAGAGASVVATMLQPNAGGRAIKIAKVTGDAIAWGPEFSEGNDESMALDVATSGARAAVAWDDMSEGGKHTAVMLASFDVASLAGVTPPRAVSRAKSDADTPRLVARPGGFWLGYVASGDADEAPAKAKKKHAAKKPKDDDENSEEVDTDVPAGEAIQHRWVELVPLDESAGPTSAPRAVTPKDGNVLAFDLKLGAGGAALVVYRDDDTPTGSGGGRLAAALVKPDGAVLPRPYKEDVAGVGAPVILPGWLAVSALNGRTYLGALDEEGDLKEPLEAEPAFGNGEPLAAKDGLLLVAKPEGKAMRLFPVKCSLPGGGR